jgi:hypothetical protein
MKKPVEKSAKKNTAKVDVKSTDKSVKAVPKVNSPSSAKPANPR